MKVAQFMGKWGPGGAEDVALKLARTLAEDTNIQSAVYVTGMNDPDWIYSRLGRSDVELKILPDNVMRHWGVKSMLQFGREMAKFLKQEGVTHLHSHMYPQILRGALTAKFMGIPHIGTLHDVYTILERPSLIRWLKVSTMLGTQLVSVSQNMNDTYHKVSRDFWFCKLPKNNPHVIYNGVDTDVFYPRECEKRPGFNLVTVGRIEDVKNYAMLIEAMRILVNKYKRNYINLTLIGDGAERDTLEQHARDFLPDNVTFLGSCKDVSGLLCEADLFVLPSKSEGLSCSILEAMASGLPILATNVGGNKELVRDNGILVPSGYPDTMAVKILQMAKRNNLKELGERSLTAVEERFSLNNMVDKYLNLYLGRH